MADDQGRSRGRTDRPPERRNGLFESLSHGQKKYRSKSCGTFLVDDKGLSRGLTDTPPECRLRLRRRPVRVPFLQYIKQDTAQGGVLFYGGR